MQQKDKVLIRLVEIIEVSSEMYQRRGKHNFLKDAGYVAGLAQAVAAIGNGQTESIVNFLELLSLEPDLVKKNLYYAGLVKGLIKGLNLAMKYLS